MIVFLVSGLWHGADYTFILWGICHGAFSVITRQWKRFFHELHPALGWTVTFSFLNITWVLFRADSLREAAQFLNRILLFNFQPIQGEITRCFRLTEIAFVLNHIPGFPVLTVYPHFFLIGFFIMAFLLILGTGNAYEKLQSFQPTFTKSFFISVLLVWCIFSFSGISVFLYFNF